MPTIAPYIVWQDVPGELALFDERDGAYHCLNPIASAVWRGLAAGDDTDALIDALAGQFDAPRAAIAADVAAFVAEARARGLLSDPGGASASAPPRAI